MVVGKQPSQKQPVTCRLSSVGEARDALATSLATFTDFLSEDVAKQVQAALDESCHNLVTARTTKLEVMAAKILTKPLGGSWTASKQKKAMQGQLTAFVSETSSWGSARNAADCMWQPLFKHVQKLVA